jgi:hypothetical protein
MSTQETALAKQEPTPLTLKPEQQSAQMSRLAAFTPTNLTEAIALSKLIATSELAPKDYRGKPGNVLIAMQMGAELGVAPMQALANIAVINGRASVWGDLALALVQVHPAYEWHKEWMEGQGDARVAVFQVKRKGQEIHTTRFSVTQAREAKLWGKRGYNGQDTPWITHPERMLAMRARGFGLRDKFADALRGMILAEEAMDIPPDTSDAKKQREMATLDVGATVSDLAPSAEPNRGHSDTGLQRTSDKKQEDWMCSKCGGKNKHEESCSQFAKQEQDRKTSKPTTKAAFHILEVKKMTKRANGEPYLILEVTDPSNHNGKLYVWHQSLHEYLLGAVDKPIMCEISEQDKDGKKYYQLEHLLEIAGVPFVDNKPAQQGAMPAQEEPF